MIFDFIIIQLISLLNNIIDLLPTANTTIINNLTTQINTLRSNLGVASWLIPSNTLLLLIGFVITIELTIIGYKIFMKLAGAITLGSIQS